MGFGSLRRRGVRVRYFDRKVDAPDSGGAGAARTGCVATAGEILSRAYRQYEMKRQILSFAFAAFVLTVTPAFAQRSVYIEDLTWPEVQQGIKSGKTNAIIYAGSTEQNGPHMAIGKHNFIARWVAGAIAIKLGDALVYPTLPFAPTGDAVKRTGHMRF